MTSPRKPITSADVARVAGVSRSAVSRTFTEGASVSAKTRHQVLEAASQLGYRPNAIARSLITQRSKMIGLVMADLSNPFYSEVLEAFSEKLQHMGLHVLLFSVARSHDVDDALPSLLQYQVDGVIITSAVLTSAMAQWCSRAGKPVVLFNRYVDDDSVSAVITDNIAGGRMMADHLIDRGFRRLAFVAGTEDTSSSTDRQRGFLERLREKDLPAPAIDRGDYRYEGGYAAANRLLGNTPRPEALFCANDMMAMGALDCARTEFGLRVPEDIAVSGYDGIPEAARPSYDLTTVLQDVEGMVERSVRLLGDYIDENPPQPRRELVPGRLIVRGSTAQPPQR